MKIGIIHVLPLEYYPPVRNTINLLSDHAEWVLQAWSTPNRRGLPEWKSKTAVLRRLPDAAEDAWLPLRLYKQAAWHIRTAVELAAWNPDAVISIEPHSTLAVWFYFRVLGGSAPLFIHHHEFYSPSDYTGRGMRILRATRRMDQDLFKRALWISQTNQKRVEKFCASNTFRKPDAMRVWPNYPRAEWIDRSRGTPRANFSGKLRFVYVGSASLEDTFIAEIAEWIARHPETTSLHVTGENISGDVWTQLRALNAGNISLDPTGCDYEELATLLRRFDVGLVLYKGNTLNFVYNVPNKAIEYLGAGLEVWYPREMEGMQDFHSAHATLPMREVNYNELPNEVPDVSRNEVPMPFPFTAEKATAPLVVELERIDRQRRK